MVGDLKIRLETPQNVYEEFEEGDLPVYPDCCDVAKDKYAEVVAMWVREHEDPRANKYFDSINVDNMPCERFVELINAMVSARNEVDVMNIASRYFRFGTGLSGAVPTSFMPAIANAVKSALAAAGEVYLQCLKSKRTLKSWQGVLKSDVPEQYKEEFEKFASDLIKFRNVEPEEAERKAWSYINKKYGVQVPKKMRATGIGNWTGHLKKESVEKALGTSAESFLDKAMDVLSDGRWRSAKAISQAVIDKHNANIPLVSKIGSMLRSAAVGTLGNVGKKKRLARFNNMVVMDNSSRPTLFKIREDEE